MRTTRMMALLPLLAGALFLGGCWIPLPEETGLVVEVLDETGNMVDDVTVEVDTTALVTGVNGDPGQVFVSYSGGGAHSVGLNPATLTDPQGGVRYVPLAAKVSGTLYPSSAWERRFFSDSGSELSVQVAKGYITRVTIYVAELCPGPFDNQWLTDGSVAMNYRPENGSREFQATPVPTFWWRENPALLGSDGSGAITNTFQLWEDRDGDIRYPLGVVDAAGFAAAVGTGNPPDWQLPHRALQRARAGAGGNGQVYLWASPASGATSYDVYWAPTAFWNDLFWYENRVLYDARVVNDGAALRVDLGHATANSRDNAGRPLLFRSGTPYTFALRARDASGNMDTLAATPTRTVTPQGDPAHPVSWAGDLAGVANPAGGSALLAWTPATNADYYRFYVAPAYSLPNIPFNDRFLWKVLPAPLSSYTLPGLLNSVTYVIGVEPVDASGNAAPGATVRVTPNTSTRTPPYVDPLRRGGQVVLTDRLATFYFNFATDSDGPVTYRIFAVPHGGTIPQIPADLNPHMDFTTIYPGTGTFDSYLTTDLSALGGVIPGVTYSFMLCAIDPLGNYLFYGGGTGVKMASSPGPVWDSLSFNPALLTGVDGRILGYRWDWTGFTLGRDPAQGKGEYVWRVRQAGPSGTMEGKLAAFYTYPGYFYHSSDTSDPDGDLAMLPVQAVTSQRRALNFLHSGLLDFLTQFSGSPVTGPVPVMGAYLGSTASATDQYRQRSVFDWSSRLESGLVGPEQVNNLHLRYNTDADGKVVTNRDGTTFLEVLLTDLSLEQNAAAGVNAAPFRPYRETKSFRLLYNAERSDLPALGLVANPGSEATGGIVFDAALDRPDESGETGPGAVPYRWEDAIW